MVIVESRHHVKKGRVDDYMDAIQDLARESQAEDGCVFFRVVREIYEPERFTVLEGYTDDTARREHMDSVHHSAFKGRIVGVLATYPEIIKGEPIYPSDPRNWL